MSARSAGILFVFMTIVGALILWWDVHERRLAKEMKTWPAATGVIKTAVIEGAKGGRRNGHIGYLARMEFSYTVKGTNFLGTRMADIPLWHHDLNDAEADIARYLPNAGGIKSGKPDTLDFREIFPTGGAVTVFYRPGDPGTSILNTASSFVGWSTVLRHVVAWPLLLLCGLASLSLLLGTFFPSLVQETGPIPAKEQQGTAAGNRPDTAAKKKFKYGGTEYDSLDEMPEDVQALFEKNGEPQEGHEDEYEDELSGKAGEDLLAKERAVEKADSKSKWHPVWCAGIVTAGLVLFGFGVYLLHIWHVVSQRGGNANPVGYAGLFLLICGVGLVIRHNWFRIATLCGLPVILMIAVPLYIRRSDAPFGSVLLAFITACAATFVFMILPPVARAFMRKPRTQDSAMRIARLAPPPRPVPFSLKLALTWGSHAGILFSMITAIVALPTVMKLKPFLKGIHFSAEPVFLCLLLILLAFIAVLIAALWLVIKSGRCDIDFFEKGLLTSARIVKKIEMKAGDTHIFRVYYEYEVNGKKYKAWDDTYFTARIEDEALEPLIYLPEKPSMCALLDSFPAHIDADYRGNWINRFPLMGYGYFAIPITVLAGAVYLAVK